MKETLYVNIIGGPGAGKSTQAALVFGVLKLDGINAELVVEYAKQCTWLENYRTLSNQFYVTAKQFYRQEMADGLVDVVITDSPIIVGIVYGGKKCPDSFENCVIDLFKMQNNLNIFIERGDYQYQTEGRTQDLEEAEVISNKIKELMFKHHIPFVTLTADGFKTTTQIHNMINRKLEYL